MAQFGHGLSSTVFKFFSGKRSPDVLAPSKTKAAAKAEAVAKRAAGRAERAQARAECLQKQNEEALVKQRAKAKAKSASKGRVVAVGYADPFGEKTGLSRTAVVDTGAAKWVSKDSVFAKDLLLPANVLKQLEINIDARTGKILRKVNAGAAPTDIGDLTHGINVTDLKNSLGEMGDSKLREILKTHLSNMVTGNPSSSVSASSSSGIGIPHASPVAFKMNDEASDSDDSMDVCPACGGCVIVDQEMEGNLKCDTCSWNLIEIK